MDTVLKQTPYFLTNYYNKEIGSSYQKEATVVMSMGFAVPVNSPVSKSIIDLSVEGIRTINDFKCKHIV